MKNIYKFSIVLLSVFTFIGCNVDDDDQEMVLPQKSITASLDDQNEIIFISDFATSYDLVVNISDELPSYSSIEYSLDGGDAIISSGNTGDSSIIISIDFDPTDAVHEVDLMDFIVVNSQARRFMPSLEGNKTVKIMRESTFLATMTWDSGADLDLDLDVMTPFWGWAGITLDASAGSGNSETVSSVLVDGNYSLWIWTNGSTNQAYTFTVTTVQGTETFTGTVDGNSWNLWFTKSGTNYTFFEEDPS
tara:strand:+ start:47214 stop:47957 length:744 start_codon:yes stop_codon:yes gene_type:complete